MKKSEKINKDHFAEREVSTPGDRAWILVFNDGSQLTVLDRMTGFGYRDIETAYRDTKGGFWLRISHDVRLSNLTYSQAIKKIKDKFTYSSQRK